LDGIHGYGLDFIPCVLELAWESGNYLVQKLEAMKAEEGGAAQ